MSELLKELDRRGEQTATAQVIKELTDQCEASVNERFGRTVGEGYLRAVVEARADALARAFIIPTLCGPFGRLMP